MITVAVGDTKPELMALVDSSSSRVEFSRAGIEISMRLVEAMVLLITGTDSVNLSKVVVSEMLASVDKDAELEANRVLSSSGNSV